MRVHNVWQVGRRELVWCVHLKRGDVWHESVSVVACAGGWEIVDCVARGGFQSPQVGRFIRGWQKIGDALTSAQVRAQTFLCTHTDAEFTIIHDITGQGLPLPYKVRGTDRFQ